MKTTAVEFTARGAFRGENGDVFDLGPCCGSTIEDSPPVSIFPYRIQSPLTNIGSWICPLCSVGI